MDFRLFITTAIIALTTGPTAKGGVVPSSLPTIGQCTFPDEAAYNRFEQTEATFYPHKPVYGIQLFNESLSQRETITHTKNPYPGSKNESCPIGQNPSSHATPDNAGTCPWYYVIDHNPDRIPTTIGRAVCRCEGCLDSISGVQHFDRTCQEVKYKMKVLHREGCDAGSFRYLVKDMEVVVACTCMRNP